jgi:hypothetical protein
MEFKVFIRHWQTEKTNHTHLESVDDDELAIDRRQLVSEANAPKHFDVGNSTFSVPNGGLLPRSPNNLVVSPQAFVIDESKTVAELESEDRDELAGTDTTPNTSAVGSGGLNGYSDPEIVTFKATANEGVRRPAVKRLQYQKKKTYHAFSSRDTDEPLQLQLDKDIDIDSEMGSPIKMRYKRSVSDSNIELSRYHFDGVCMGGQEDFVDMVLFRDDGSNFNFNEGAHMDTTSALSQEQSETYIFFGENKNGKSYSLFGDISNDKEYGIVVRLVARLLAVGADPSATVKDGAQTDVSICCKVLLGNKNSYISPNVGIGSEFVDQEDNLLIANMATFLDIVGQLQCHPLVATSHLLFTVKVTSLNGIRPARTYQFVELKSSIVRVPRDMLPLIPSLCASQSKDDLLSKRNEEDVYDADKALLKSQQQLQEMYGRVDTMLSAWLEDSSDTKLNPLRQVLQACFHCKTRTALVGVFTSCGEWFENFGDGHNALAINPTIQLALALRETADVIGMCQLLVNKVEDLEPAVWAAENVVKTFTPSYSMLSDGNAALLSPERGLRLDSLATYPEVSPELSARSSATNDGSGSGAFVPDLGISYEDGGLQSIQDFKGIINSKLTEIFQSENYLSRCLNAEKACVDLEKDKEKLLIKLRTAENELRLYSEVLKSPTGSMVLGSGNGHMTGYERKISDLGEMSRVVQVVNLDSILDPFEGVQPSQLRTDFDDEHRSCSDKDKPFSPSSNISGSSFASDLAARTASASLSNPFVDESLNASNDVDDDDELFQMPSITFFSPNIFDGEDDKAATTLETGHHSGGSSEGRQHRRLPSMNSANSMTSRSSRSENWANTSTTIDSSVADHIRMMKEQYREINSLIDKKLEQVKLSEEQRREIEQTRLRLEEERTEKEKYEQSYLEMVKNFETLKAENRRLQEEQLAQEARIHLLEEEKVVAKTNAEKTHQSSLMVNSNNLSANRGHIGNIAVVLPGAQQQKWDEMFSMKSASVEFVYRSDDDDEGGESDGSGNDAVTPRQVHRNTGPLSRNGSASTDDNGVDFENCDDGDDSDNEDFSNMKESANLATNESFFMVWARRHFVLILSADEIL